MIDTYLTYLRDVRRVAQNTIESYARDLAALAAFADESEASGRDARRGATWRRSSAIR